MSFISIWNPIKGYWQTINLNLVIEYHFEEGYTIIVTSAGTYAAEGDVTNEIKNVIRSHAGTLAIIPKSEK